MYKIKVNGSIKNIEIKELTAQEVELVLNTKISDSILIGVKEQLENFSFIDIAQNVEKESFDWNADIIVCSESQVKSSLAMVVQNLVTYGVPLDKIGDILEPLQNDMKGW